MELLTKIWDDAPGQRVVLYKRGGQKKGGRNEFFADSASAYNFVREKNADGFDVWFALALFGDEAKRTQSNALSVKSFWLDIDVGEGKPYANITDAANALAGFCDSLALPLPTLVSSGTGLHAHWITDTRIAKDRWETSAKALKTACTRLGLKAGPERTADIASVLRIPGTKHLKDPTQPKPVSLVGTIQPVVPLTQFESAVARFITVDNKRQANKVFEVDLPKLPSDANKIAEGCAVVREMRDTKGCVPEPQWYATIQLLTHTIDGERLAHEWSRGYEGYDQEVTQTKYDRATEFGPTLCGRFAELRPELCAACSYRGKIATPLQIGVTVTPVVQRRTEGHSEPLHSDERLQPSQSTSHALARLSDQGQQDVEIEPSDNLRVAFPYYVPRLYLVGEEGVFYSDPDKETPTRIVDIALGLKSINAIGNEAQFVFEWKNATGEFCESQMPASTLTELRALDAWLMNNYITGFNPHMLDAIRIYMRACVTERRKRELPQQSYDHNGWVDDTDAFVLGKRIIKPSGIYPVQMSRVRKSIQDLLVEKGDFETWAKTTELIATGDNYLPHRFTMTAAFGSILFSLLDAKGAVLSLAGTASGTGKTTISQFAVSAFGHVDATQIGSDSTNKFFYEQWAVNGSLPTLVDEITALDPNVLKVMIYAAGKGQGRGRLKRTGDQDDTKGWKCLTIVTTNAPLMDYPERLINSANKMRILELILTDPEHMMDRAHGVQMARVMETNYGVVGRVFIEECVRRRDEIKALTEKMYDAFVNAKSVPSQFRFSQWLIASAVVAGKIAEDLNILRFDTEEACRWANTTLVARGKNVESTMDKMRNAASDYIRVHQGGFSSFSRKTNFWTADVRGECFGRYTTEIDGTLTLSIPVTQFLEFCRERGVDRSLVQRWIKESKADTKTVRIVQQGDQGEKGLTCRCYVLPVGE